ncbi:MAG: outer membrane lipoprotein carrier protein LolA [Lentimicrobiaceae bacterium]|nr:outer membrane lipoprotein carrier protein LolA [Lentimicrobiaceae bacterium]
MNRLKKFFFFTLIFFVSFSLLAQNETHPAAPILNKTTQKYNSLAAFSFDFQMKMEIDELLIHSFDGVLLVKKEKYFLTFEDQIIANDGKMMWNYQKNTNEASLFDAEEDDFAGFNPITILNNWDKDYNAKLIREEELHKKTMFILDLTPKKKTSFYKIRLYIEKDNSSIYQVIMYEIDGPTLTYTITKFNPSVAITDTKFTFNKNDYPNVQVIDMR